MVGGGIGDDRRVGIERDERAIAFIDFGDGVGALPEMHRPFPAGYVRAVDAERIESALRENVSEHGGDGRFAAGADDGDEPMSGERVGERLRAVGDGDAEPVGPDETGIVLLDRGRHDHFVHRFVDAAAVVGENDDSERFEPAEVGGAERAVGARDGAAELDQCGGEGAHADAADADEVFFHRNSASNPHETLARTRITKNQPIVFVRRTCSCPASPTAARPMAIDCGQSILPMPPPNMFAATTTAGLTPSAEAATAFA